MRINKDTLLRWQRLDAAIALVAVSEYAKLDITFKPTKCSNTSRWHATVGGNEFELLLTGAKFWDTRAKVGGGGALDLVMHLTETEFIRASAVLRELQL